MGRGKKGGLNAVLLYEKRRGGWVRGWEEETYQGPTGTTKICFLLPPPPPPPPPPPSPPCLAERLGTMRR